jgi:hypothetical protein
MDTITRRSAHPLLTTLAAVTLALALALGAGGTAGATTAVDGAEDALVLAAEERERRPIATTQRDQLGLVLYGLMALAVLAGGATLRRQLRGDRPQSDGEFRWR